MEEIWKDIKGYEGYYQISNLGRVKSLPRLHKKWDGHNYICKEKILKQAVNTGGYHFVELFKNGIGRITLVHKLVAESFVPNPKNLPELNHIDEVKTNNRADNLEWCNHLYNMRYGTRTQRAIEPQCKTTLMLSKEGKVLRRFKSLNGAARELGIEASGICICISGKIKSYKGYVWKYE